MSGEVGRPFGQVFGFQAAAWPCNGRCYTVGMAEQGRARPRRSALKDMPGPQRRLGSHLKDMPVTPVVTERTEPEAAEWPPALDTRLRNTIGRAARLAALTRAIQAAPPGTITDGVHAIDLLRDQIQQRRDLISAIAHNIGLPETSAVTERPCACGCGQPVTSPRPEAKYATGACRVRALRAHRAREAEARESHRARESEARESEQVARRECPECGQLVKLKQDGTLASHKWKGQARVTADGELMTRCPGGSVRPA
jgi:hypothetical protein